MYGDLFETRYMRTEQTVIMSDQFSYPSSLSVGSKWEIAGLLFKLFSQNIFREVLADSNSINLQRRYEQHLICILYSNTS